MSSRARRQYGATSTVNSRRVSYIGQKLSLDDVGNWPIYRRTRHVAVEFVCSTHGATSRPTGRQPAVYATSKTLAQRLIRAYPGHSLSIDRELSFIMPARMTHAAAGEDGQRIGGLGVYRGRGQSNERADGERKQRASTASDQLRPRRD